MLLLRLGPSKHPPSTTLYNLAYVRSTANPIFLFFPLFQFRCKTQQPISGSVSHCCVSRRNPAPQTKHTRARFRSTIASSPVTARNAAIASIPVVTSQRLHCSSPATQSVLESHCFIVEAIHWKGRAALVWFTAKPETAPLFVVEDVEDVSRRSRAIELQRHILQLEDHACYGYISCAILARGSRT